MFKILILQAKRKHSENGVTGQQTQAWNRGERNKIGKSKSRQNEETTGKEEAIICDRGIVHWWWNQRMKF